MWKNTLEADRPQMTVWCMCFTCWVPKATNTHSEYVILIFFHNNNICTNALHCYVIAYCLSCWHKRRAARWPSCQVFPVTTQFVLRLEILSSSPVPEIFWVHPISYLIYIRRFSTGIKQPNYQIKNNPSQQNSLGCKQMSLDAHTRINRTLGSLILG